MGVTLGRLVRATRGEQAESMRIVRNTCRSWMTNNQREIDASEQAKWFNKVVRSTIVYPFVYDVGNESVGYGLVRQEHGKWWLSGGLLPEWRAYGHGTALFSGLSEFVEGTLLAAPWLTVWASNTAAVETYKKLGFLVSIQVDNDEQLLVMVRR